MVTSINLGGFSQQNGRTVVTGTSSGGLDTESLINSLTEARRLPAVQLEDRIEQNGLISEKFQELQNILTSFQDASDLLRNPPGVGNENQNAFELRNALVSGNVGGPASDFLSVTAQAGASISNYDVSIEQLATSNIKITNTFALADADTDAVGAGLPFNAGTLTIGAAGIDVEIDDDDSLNQIASKINAVSNLSNVEANIIKVSDGNFRLSLKTTVTGTDQNYDLGIPTPPSFVNSDAIFRLDANDIDGDLDYLNNPGADQPVAAPADATGSTTITTSGTSPNLDVNGTPNGIATLDFSGGNQAYTVANTPEINDGGGPYSEKSFAFSFQTGADISGTQTIYEQGGAGRSFGLFIQDDGGTPTLFGVAYNNNEWDPGEEFKVVNLGAVTANTNYNVVLDFDATANPSANDAANTFTGYVNGVQVDQVTGVREQFDHNGSIGIGATINDAGLPDGTTAGGAPNNFRGTINEIALFNRSLNGAEIGEISTYFDDKFNQPITTSSVFNVGFAVNQAAQNSQVTIDGTTITRQTNSVDDAIEGLTFNLQAETSPGDTLNVRVDADRELVTNAIINFVDAYNSFRIFAAEQTEIGDDGTPTDDALLASSTTLRTITSRISAEVSSVVDGLTAGNIDRLADIGLEFNDFPGDSETPFVRNILTVDEDKLSSALAADYEQVRDLFEFDFVTDDINLTVFSRTNNLDVTSIDLNIDQTNGVYEATFDDGSGPQTIALEASPLSGSGITLTGPQGSALDGLVLIYADTGDATVNLDLSQGIADRIFNSMEEILENDSGLLPIELQTLADTNDRLQEEIDRIDRQVERFREQLLQQFSALEQAIAQADVILQNLAAQENARLAAG